MPRARLSGSEAPQSVPAIPCLLAPFLDSHDSSLPGTGLAEVLPARTAPGAESAAFRSKTEPVGDRDRAAGKRRPETARSEAHSAGRPSESAAADQDRGREHHRGAGEARRDQQGEP